MPKAAQTQTQDDTSEIDNDIAIDDGDTEGDEGDSLADGDDGAVDDDGEGSETTASDEDPDAGEGATEEDADGDELVISLEDETLTPSDEEERRAPKWVREMRQQHRALIRERNQLRDDLRKAQGGGVVAPVAEEDIGAEPTMEDQDVDYDHDKFKAKYATWYQKKQDRDQRKQQREDAQAKEVARWDSTKSAYNTAKAKMKVSDFDVAESTVLESLNVVQQAVILDGWSPDRASLLIYAMGKSPKMLQQLKTIENPIKFAVAVADMEKKLKVANGKKPAPSPERQLRSGVTGAAAVDNQLAKLEAEADRTGDRSKVVAHRAAKNKRSA